MHAVNWGYVGILMLKGLGLISMIVLPWVMLYGWFMGVL